MTRYLAALAFVACLLASAPCAQAADFPMPISDEAKAPASSSETVVLAGGCFWGLQDVFDHVKGVTHVTAGYTGGKAETADYEKVSSGDTGHAESVQVTYDPSQVTLGQLLRVYFSVAHDPTELNRQGPDHGTQYRSAVFYASKEQQQVTDHYIAQLQAAKAYSQPVVTEVSPLQGFYPAEAYHQGYAASHPFNPYIIINDAPKVAQLEKKFPDLYAKK